jgi:hypothetical protein
MGTIGNKIESHLVGSTTVAVFQPRFGKPFEKQGDAYVLGSISYNPKTGMIQFPDNSIDVRGAKIPNKQVALIPNGRGTLEVFYRESDIGQFKKLEIRQDGTYQ